jgi:hypothetical protein
MILKYQSYAHILDPASKLPGDKTSGGDEALDKVSAIAIAFGLLRLGASVSELLVACGSITEYIQRILDNPNVKSFWRILIAEKDYNQKIGRLFGGNKLMQAMGFHIEDNGTVLALRDEVPRFKIRRR